MDAGGAGRMIKYLLPLSTSRNCNMRWKILDSLNCKGRTRDCRYQYFVPHACILSLQARKARYLYRQLREPSGSRVMTVCDG